jgi:hypothetical protein
VLLGVTLLVIITGFIASRYAIRRGRGVPLTVIPDHMLASELGLRAGVLAAVGAIALP